MIRQTFDPATGQNGQPGGHDEDAPAREVERKSLGREVGSSLLASASCPSDSLEGSGRQCRRDGGLCRHNPARLEPRAVCLYGLDDAPACICAEADGERASRKARDRARLTGQKLERAFCLSACPVVSAAPLRPSQVAEEHVEQPRAVRPIRPSHSSQSVRRRRRVREWATAMRWPYPPGPGHATSGATPAVTRRSVGAGSRLTPTTRPRSRAPRCGRRAPGTAGRCETARQAVGNAARAVHRRVSV